MIRMIMTNQPTDGDAHPTRGLRSIARTWFWFILLGTVVGVVAAFLISAVTPATYTARVSRPGHPGQLLDDDHDHDQ